MLNPIPKSITRFLGLYCGEDGGVEAIRIEQDSVVLYEDGTVFSRKPGELQALPPESALPGILGEANTALLSGVAQLQTQVRELEGQLEDASAQIGGLQSQRDAAQRQAQDLQAQLLATLGQAGALAAQVRSLQDQLAALQAPQEVPPEVPAEVTPEPEPPAPDLEA